LLTLLTVFNEPDTERPKSHSYFHLLPFYQRIKTTHVPSVTFYNVLHAFDKISSRRTLPLPAVIRLAGGLLPDRNTKRVGAVSTLLTRIREVLGSNPGSNTDCPELFAVFLCHSWQNSGAIYGTDNDHAHPDPLQLIGLPTDATDIAVKYTIKAVHRMKTGAVVTWSTHSMESKLVTVQNLGVTLPMDL
jgi:hypothetical protein